MNHPRRKLTQLIMTVLPPDYHSPTNHSSPEQTEAPNLSLLFAEALSDAIFQQFHVTLRTDSPEPTETPDGEDGAICKLDDQQRVIYLAHANPGKPTEYHYQAM